MNEKDNWVIEAGKSLTKDGNIDIVFTVLIIVMIFFVGWAIKDYLDDKKDGLT